MVTVNINLMLLVDSVNIILYCFSMVPREHYHHGDLRSVLLTEGLKQLEASGLDFSLRALAKAAGVSPNAPYRHFADKNALMGALAAEGFKAFADAIVGASDLRDQGRAYLEFGLANPALYRLMFSPYGYSLTSDTCQSQANRAFGALVAMAARAQASGWKSGQGLQVSVLEFWSALHGWVGLVNDGLLPPEVSRPTVEQWLDAQFA